MNVYQALMRDGKAKRAMAENTYKFGWKDPRNMSKTELVKDHVNYRSLYELTGDISDINTILVPRTVFTVMRACSELRQDQQ